MFPKKKIYKVTLPSLRFHKTSIDRRKIGERRVAIGRDLLLCIVTLSIMCSRLQSLRLTADCDMVAGLCTDEVERERREETKSSGSRRARLSWA